MASERKAQKTLRVFHKPPQGEIAPQVEVGTVDLVLAVDTLPGGVAQVASEEVGLVESRGTPVISTVRELAVVSNHYPDRELAELSVFR